jgi:alginate O-acetyltransferase complex protein AlgI
LIFFKYLLFLNGLIHDAFGITAIHNVKLLKFGLPLGISFYTFHLISYQIDVYRCEVAPEKKLNRFIIYIALFPHMIAGPVVRFSEIKTQLDGRQRKIVGKDVFWGLAIFIVGLAKKTLIADPLGAVVDSVHANFAGLSTYSAWVAAICYSLQIYFDFSGYTDMAIGMARMMGFRFPQNFNRPYMARSITEFWQRWHITLSRWFRDYVYIPLGGNRNGAAATYRNLMIVFVLCALWHGAAYTFLIWGAAHGVLLCMERAKLFKPTSFRMGHIAIFFITTLLWVPFRAENVSEMRVQLATMFGLDRALPLWVETDRALIDPKIIVLIVVAFIICLTSHRRFFVLRAFSFRHPHMVACACILLFLLSCISAVDRGFNPFIYFQF